MFYTENEKNYLQDVYTDLLDLRKESEFILEISSNPMIRSVAEETLDECDDSLEDILLAFAVGDLVPTTSETTEAPGETEDMPMPGMMENVLLPQSIIDVIDKWEKALKDRPGSMPGGRYPVNNAGQLQDAIRAVGRSKGGAKGRAAVRRHIISRARALGLSDQIPDTWNSDGSLKPGS